MLSKPGLGNEWRLVLRHPLVWLASAGFIGFAAVFAKGAVPPGAGDAIAALLRLNLYVPALLLPFVAGALGPVFFLREVDHGMGEMLGAYPLTARRWLAMRAGSFMLLLLALSAIAQAIFLAFMASRHPALAPALISRSMLWLTVVHIPACLMWSAGLAWLACRKANAGYLYLATGLGWLAYLALSSLTGTPLIAGSITPWPALRAAMLVIDPYAATALWNALPDQGLLGSATANLIAGRALWLLAAAGLLRAIRDVPSRAGHLESETAGPERAGGADRPGHGQLAVLLRYVFSDRVFPLIVGALLILSGTESFAGMDSAEPLTVVIPDSRDALNRVAWDLLPAIAALVLLYAADRICRMYQATGMDELYAATPHRAFRLVASQLASLWLIAAGSLGLAGLAVMAAQLVAGAPIDPREYLLQLGLTLPGLALTGTVLVAIHGLIRTRFLANLTGLGVIVLGQSNLAPSLGLHDPMWRLLDTPLAMPDHYWGFEGTLAGHLAFLLFWLPLVLALLVVAVLLHHRTLPFRQVSWQAARDWRLWAIVLPLTGLGVWQGQSIHARLLADGALVSPAQRNAWRAGYERQYARWRDLPQPDVQTIASQVDFFPTSGFVRITATLQLVNRAAVPIGRILVGRNVVPVRSELQLAGAALLHRDLQLGQTIFALDRPMQPGEVRALTFKATVVQSGLTEAMQPLVLRGSFSSLPLHGILPVIGYRPEFALRRAETRLDYDLPVQTFAPPSRLPVPARASLARDEVRLDLTVSTTGGQFAVAQGRLLRRWQLGGRRYFHFRSDGPIRNLPAAFSVPWQPQSWSAGRFTLAYHGPRVLPGNDPNVLAMRDTIEWLDREVAPYPGSDLRLLAVPDIGLSGYALPQILQISNRLGFRARPGGEAGFDQRYRRAAHETAHQWFGHSLGHGNARERAFLVESLAKYAELAMIERRFGTAAMLAVVDFERGRYRIGRLDPDQPIPPLIDADDGEDMYSRATLVFACVRQKVGDGPVLAALRGIAVESRRSATPARSLDFVTALQAAIRPDLRAPLGELFLGSAPLDRQLARLGCR